MEMQSIFRYETANRKCGACNFRARIHFVMEENGYAAREEFDFFDNRGLCGSCLAELLVEEGYRLIDPDDVETIHQQPSHESGA